MSRNDYKRYRTQTTKLDQAKLTFQIKEVNFTKIQPQEQNEVKRVIPLGLEDGIAHIGKRLFSIKISEKKVDDLIQKQISIVDEALLTNLGESEKLEKYFFLQEIMVLALSNLSGRDRIILIFEGQVKNEILTRDAKKVEVFKVNMPNALGITHFTPKNDQDDQLILKINWAYSLRKDHFELCELKGIEDLYMDTQILKMTDTTLMLISKRKVKTYGRGMGFNGQFAPALIANSFVFGVYSYQTIKSIALASNRQLIVLCIKQPVDKKKGIFEEFHTSYSVHDLSVLLEVDNTLKKDWNRIKGEIIDTGVWCSSKGYFTYFLTNRQNGLFFELIHMNRLGAFTGHNHSFLVNNQDEEIKEIFNPEMYCLSKKKGEFLVKYIYKGKKIFVGFKINFMGLVLKAFKSNGDALMGEFLTEDDCELDMCPWKLNNLESRQHPIRHGTNMHPKK